MAEAILSWVIVDGVARHVSEFAAFPPRRRPRARCPECDRRVTLKLGRVRQHHAAHAPGELCAATAPETALHLNAKFALGAVLRSMAGPHSRLRIVQHCAAMPGQTCDAALEREWMRGWRDVRVEHRIAGARRPDIVLRRSRRDVAGIELLVAHAVPDEKIAALDALEFPWIEVRATTELAGARSPADIELLAVLRESAGEPWRCEAHARAFERLVSERLARDAAAAEARRHSTVVEAARVVDIYYPGGERERYIYRVERLSTDDVPHSMRLMRGGLEIASVPVRQASEAPEIAASLQLAFRGDVKRLASPERSIVDSPMRWAGRAAAQNIVEEALSDTLGHDPTPLATRLPRRWFFTPQRGEWFLPADMRDVRWDRPEVDAFGPHPAWSRARAVVRERPVPEARWDTSVFAARPVAALMAHRVRGARLVDDAGRKPGVARVQLQRHDGRQQNVVVLERQVPNDVIAAITDDLSSGALSPIWFSHPLDWSPALIDLAWVPAGRDPRGRSLAVVDGIGVFRGDQFLRALIAADPRLSPDALRAHVAARAQSLASHARS